MKTPQQNLTQENPFAQQLPLYEKAREQSQKLSEEEVAADWIQNKRSNDASDFQNRPVTYVLPVSGTLIRI